MQLGYRKMGCGRSKHEQSNKNSQEDVNNPQKTGKKKKLKGEKKENKDPKKVDKGDNHVQHQHYEKHNPVHTQNMQHNTHVSKPPVLSVNGSHSQELNIDIDLPAYKEKDNRFLMPTRDGKPDATFQSSKHIKVTHSQIEFFKMLDEKIEQGGDETDDRETDTSSPCD